MLVTCRSASVVTVCLHVHVVLCHTRACIALIGACPRVQDSDELWMLSPPARRSLETLLRNSSDASVRAPANMVAGWTPFQMLQAG